MKKHPPARNSRHFTKIKINYTHLVKDWSYNDRKCRETFLVPFGMIKALEKPYSNKKTYHSYHVLPENTKQELSLTSDEYENDKMKLIVSHQGNRGIKSCHYVCCTICHKDKIPVILEKV